MCEKNDANQIRFVIVRFQGDMTGSYNRKITITCMLVTLSINYVWKMETINIVIQTRNQ